MTMDEIMDVIKQLAQSQGMYGRLYRDIQEIKEEAPGEYEKLKADWEARNFKTALDFILFIEE